MERISRTGQKSVELHQQFKIDIVTLGSFAVAAPDMMAIKVDAWLPQLSV
jgi:hypothetical protein